MVTHTPTREADTCHGPSQSLHSTPTVSNHRNNTSCYIPQCVRVNICPKGKPADRSPNNMTANAPVRDNSVEHAISAFSYGY